MELNIKVQPWRVVAWGAMAGSDITLLSAKDPRDGQPVECYAVITPDEKRKITRKQKLELRKFKVEMAKKSLIRHVETR